MRQTLGTVRLLTAVSGGGVACASGVPVLALTLPLTTGSLLLPPPGPITG